MPLSERWTLHPALAKLRDQVNTRYPGRSRVSDGTIGDGRHSVAKSDHNPNAQGIVCAMDITHDPAHGFNAATFAEALRRSQDPRIKYVIFNSRIFSSTVRPWEWRKYNGANPHDHHVHVSVGGAEPPWTF